MTPIPNIACSKQRGAALVVGLVLLVAITLMAIGSMNTASLDLMMAANEQYQSRSFHAAERAVEVAFNNNPAFDSTTDYPLTVATSGIGNDMHKYSVTRPTVGVFPPGSVAPAPVMISSGTFGAVYFAINAVGTSERGAVTTVRQELFEVVKTSNEFNCLTPPCTL
jgi:hypothetical protein